MERSHSHSRSPSLSHSLLALALALAACTAPVPVPVGYDTTPHHSHDAPRSPPPSGRSPTDTEYRAIHTLMRAAERVRSLRFARDVPVRIQSADEITAFVASRIDERELERARVFYTAIGLLPADLDVRQMLLDVMGEQIVGFYDPDSATLVVRDDIARALVDRDDPDGDHEGLGSEIVLVHELVHALQDQQLGLGERYHFAEGHRERTGDETNAFMSLVEGDATLAMLGWVAERAHRHLSDLTRDPETLRALLSPEAVTGGGPALAAAPSIVRAPLLSRYLDGMIFCAALHARGGFRIIDAAHRDPPTTSEQVVHPERYFAHHEARRIEMPTLAALESVGFTAHHEDTLGEVELGVWLAIGSGDDRDAAAADGWDGDLLRVYRDANGATCSVWWTAWDTEADAIEADDAATRVATTLPTTTTHRTARALAITIGCPDAARSALDAAFDTFAATVTPP